MTLYIYSADAIKAIYRLLQDVDTKVVSLTLVLAETCMKNCPSFPPLVNKQFMEEIVAISTGRKGFQNQEEALRLIQLWGKQYERARNEFPIFYDTYVSMRNRGARFPKDDTQISDIGSKY
jgi:hypothetical protein